ncbi:acylglycerol kinase family protein [Parerythrobacter lacustris]|uniref:Acylglycerol kinase family protein n=1 Tax=Parerythrobacter lacustris TaxID=2969984 RepID=A0ABT1XS67_9SPHN|nr:acylglycerol kinase family protein [Parerythrobacter lacustris]MCR2834493.1 acylglycerol kinase family protein [Parerythrobacter lacustris]
MPTPTPIWLVANAASGSNSEAAVEALHSDLEANNFEVRRTIAFPDDALPNAGDLDAAGIDMLAVFTGDGTVNALLTALYGWAGAVLVLPGGTMNLLSLRLHGKAEVGEILSCVARNGARRVRPKVARCSAGDAFAGLLVGPGTCWSSVREAMRTADVVGVLQGAAEAISQTLDGPPVKLLDPPVGMDDGYPLMEITPTELGLAASGFHARTTTDMVSQSWALMRRRFREGPHDRLGLFGQMRLGAVDACNFPVLIDGEPQELASPANFALVECEVDLLAIGSDG